MVYFNPSAPGNNNDKSARLANHVPCVKDGIIKKYKDRNFTEYVIIHDMNKYMTSDEGDKLIEGGQLEETTKKEIVYVVN